MTVIKEIRIEIGMDEDKTIYEMNDLGEIYIKQAHGFVMAIPLTDLEAVVARMKREREAA